MAETWGRIPNEQTSAFVFSRTLKPAVSVRHAGAEINGSVSFQGCVVRKTDVTRLMSRSCVRALEVVGLGAEANIGAASAVLAGIRGWMRR
jgi:hypothetical protein